MQKGTVIPGRNDHTLLPYHLVLPCTPGSPQIPVPGWISCIQGYRANLITACIYTTCPSLPSGREQLSPIVMTNSTGEPCLTQTTGVILTPGVGLIQIKAAQLKLSRETAKRTDASQ